MVQLKLKKCTKAGPNNQLWSPLRDWDGLSAAARLQDRPQAGRYASGEETDGHQ